MGGWRECWESNLEEAREVCWELYDGKETGTEAGKLGKNEMKEEKVKARRKVKYTRRGRETGGKGHTYWR